MMMNLFLFIFTMITYVSIAIMGVLRTFFIGAAFALMPVLLVIRLMPYVDRVADLFIQVIVGGVLASIIVSFFFAFGYDVLTSASISGLMKTLIALGVLLACPPMMTVLIPHLGSLMSSMFIAITGRQ
jgi:predicted phage tail protein